MSDASAQQPQHQQRAVPLQPVPFGVGVAVDKLQDGSNLVRLVYQLPSGDTYLWMDPKMATTHGKAILDAARQAGTGIVVPQVHLPGGTYL